MQLRGHHTYLLGDKYGVPVIRPSRDRYAIPFFFDASADYPMACLPSCRAANQAPRYEPVTYTDYMRWFTRQYDHVRERGVPMPADPGVPERPTE